MIGRRTFGLGLGAMGLAGLGLGWPRDAAAALRINGRLFPDKDRKLRDIPYTPFEQIPNHRQYMRDIVIALSSYAKGRKSNFIMLGRDAPELLVKDQREWDWESGRDVDGAAAGKYTPVGSVVRPYLKAIDGILFDGLFCGMDGFDQPTDPTSAKVALSAVSTLQKEGRRVFSLEYAKDKTQVAAATKKAAQVKVLDYVTQDDARQFGQIPAGRPPSENAEHVTDLDHVRNFLPLLHSTAFGSKDDWVSALARTNYDMLLLDPFWRGVEPLTAIDIKALQMKQLGSRRLVLAELSLGRAMDTKFYWKKDWTVGSPDWLVAPAPDQPGQTMVRYWDEGWKSVIGQYMQGLIDIGVDGVLLNDLDAYFYFEDMMPLR
ncbi:hypothetical protein [Telmatospirillum siberiense]|uniref:Glycoside-hydrolase family GH114 TIM-barrel domain-containing protein n=1 Tax=Telmatospirillum siberiense TaxID=382514 RepID=A0A2N3PZR9_9PROT|nr:hypothetical protein [Telmatospirillum siberiense]PKU25893.1 hypothetical protein CWS72_04905 [Telmatospirillum siberiense]